MQQIRVKEFCNDHNLERQNVGNDLTNDDNSERENEGNDLTVMVTI